MSDISATHRTVAELRATVFGRDLGFLLRAGRRIHQIEREIRGRQPLTPPQFAIMLAATRLPGSDQATLGRLAVLDSSTMSETVRRLRQKRLVRSEPDPHDARRSLLYPEEGSRDLVDAYLLQLEHADDRVLEMVPPSSRRRFLALLRAIAYRGSTPSADGVETIYAESETFFAFGRLIRVAAQQFNEDWSTRSPGLASIHYEALLLLREFDGISQNFAGHVLYLDRATVALLVHRLEDAELVVGRPSATDRRRREISLAPAGRAKLAALGQTRTDVQEGLLRPLSPEDQAAFLGQMVELVRITSAELN